MHRSLFAFSALAALAAATDKGDAVLETDAPAVDAVDLEEVEVVEPPFTEDEGRTAVESLILLDVKCRAAGHSLAEILAVVAQNTYGIDVR